MTDTPSWPPTLRKPADCPVIDGVPIISEVGDPADLAEMAELVEKIGATPDDQFVDVAQRFRLPNRPYTLARRRSEERALSGFFRGHGDLSKRRILNVSCGIGREAQILLERGARRLFLYDISTPAVRYAHRTLTKFYPDAELGAAVGDACDLPFDDGAFDLVFVYASAHHYPDIPGFLREAARVGSEVCLVSEPAKLGPWQRLLDAAGWNTEYGGIRTARLDERELRAAFRDVPVECRSERLSQYVPRMLDRFGNSRFVVSGWFGLLRLIDAVTPSGWRHSLNFYARPAKAVG